jgi:hypothetical protein
LPFGLSPVGEIRKGVHFSVNNIPSLSSSFLFTHIPTFLPFIYLPPSQPSPKGEGVRLLAFPPWGK